MSLFCFAYLFSQIPAGAIAYYPFNGNANDSSGNGNNGCVYGPALTTDRFGNANQAYDFNGVNNCIITPLGNDSLRSLTISLWFKCKQKFDFPITSNKFNIIDFSDDNNNVSDAIGAWDFSDNIDSVKLSGFTYNSACAQMPYGKCNRINIISSIIDTTWYHIVYIRNENSISLYLNGVLQGSISYNGKYQIENCLVIGKLWKTWNGNNFNGKIDDIRIYDRTLNTTEINLLFNENKLKVDSILIPTLTVNQTSLSFGNAIINTISSEQTYTLTGSNLSPANDSLTITAPLGFTLSTVSGSRSLERAFALSKRIAYTGSTLSSTTIYVKFSPTAVQSYAGNITNSGGDATTQNVLVTGTGINKFEPKIILNSKNINMGTVKVGKTKDTVLTITNTGNTNLIISCIASNNVLFIVKTLTFNILPGETVKDTISFEPPFEGSSYDGNNIGIIFIVSNASSSPDTVTVTANVIPATAVKGIVEISKEYMLYQNYPNPFNPTTTISYSIPKAGLVTVDIYDIQGQLVQTLSTGIQSIGKHSVQWNATKLSSGMYICRIIFGNIALVNKLMLTK